MGWISFIVYLVNTSVTFINVLISSFRYSAATVQDLSTGLLRAIYKEQLILHQDICSSTVSTIDPVLVDPHELFTRSPWSILVFELLHISGVSVERTSSRI